jgi:lipoate-protein ligase A
VETLTVRVLPHEVADGPQNMAADEALLHSAASGAASLRWYEWSQATASLGYFQPCHVLEADPLLRTLPVVRRPTGGKTLVHHRELTYALALPPEAIHGPVAEWLERVHKVIAHALSRFGVTAELADQTAGENADPLCFEQITRGDLLLAGNKIVGSAQRRRHGALLQHGAILLARSPFTPSLPGLAELAGAPPDVGELCSELQELLAREMRWRLRLGLWDRGESDLRAGLAVKYASDSWTRKR